MAGVDRPSGKLVKVVELEVAKAFHSVQAVPPGLPRFSGLNGGDNPLHFLFPERIRSDSIHHNL